MEKGRGKGRSSFNATSVSAGIVAIMENEATVAPRVGRASCIAARILVAGVPDVALAPILLPQDPETGRTKAKDYASTDNGELVAVTRFSRKIRGLPVMAVLYS